MILIIPLFAILSIVVFFFVLYPRKNGPFNPPPGPQGLPFIGNLLQFDTSKTHVYFAELAKTYGPIVSLQIGRVPIVVVNSAKLAREVLHTQDLNFCSRPQMIGMQRLSYNGLDIAFAPYNEYFREIKKISVVHLLSSKRVESYAPIRHEEVSRMIDKITSLSSSSNIVNLSELLMSFASSTICRIAFGNRYEDNEGGSRSRFHTILNEAQTLFTIFFFSDYFPLFSWIDKLNGQISRLEKTFKILDELYEEIINDHLDPNSPQSDRKDIIDVLLHLKKDSSFELSLDHIKAVIMIIFIAGTDTSSATIVWAMTELMRNPTSMKTIQEELRKAIKNKDGINYSDLKELNFFKAVVKETFRLHPVAPLLVAHESIRKSTIEGFDILPKTVVYVNAWAIGRDPKSFEDPEKFKPERFLESSIDFRGYDFELIPFGAGRRICPGLHLGVANIEIALANLLYYFDWELPPKLKNEDIDIDVLPGITVHKKDPLCLYAKVFQQIK